MGDRTGSGAWPIMLGAERTQLPGAMVLALWTPPLVGEVLTLPRKPLCPARRASRGGRARLAIGPLLGVFSRVVFFFSLSGFTSPGDCRLTVESDCLSTSAVSVSLFLFLFSSVPAPWDVPRVPCAH